MSMVEIAIERSKISKSLRSPARHLQGGPQGRPARDDTLPQSAPEGGAPAEQLV